jgi:hypothetical protein
MRYMMFIKHTEDYGNRRPPESLFEAMGAFVEGAQKSGKLIDAAGLLPTAAAHRVTLRGGRITTTDGPFTESKEIVGGYALMELSSTEEALDLARRFMDLHRVHWPEFEGDCEVRPLENPGGAPGEHATARP